MTWLLIDGVLLAVFIILCIVGSVKGFVKMAMRVFGKLGALIVAYAFSDEVAAIINEKYFGPYFHGVFTEYVQKIAVNAAGDVNELPALFKTVVSMLGYNLEELVVSIQTTENAAPIAQHLATPVANIVSSATAFAGLFFAVLIVAWIVKLILSALAKLPVIATVNKWLGFALGAVEGFIVVCVIATAINAFFPYLQAENLFGLASVSLEQTYIFKFINEINPLNIIFS